MLIKSNETNKENSEIEITNVKKKVKESNEDTSITKFRIQCFLTTFFTIHSLQYMLSIALTICGIVYHPFFFSILLIDVLSGTVALRSVLMAMYTPRYQIFITLALILIFEYFFALISIRWLYLDYPNKKDVSNFISILMRNLEQTFKVK